MENMEQKKTAEIMKKENDYQTTSILNKNAQLAAIYISDEAKKEVNISRQVKACQEFLNDHGLVFSGDLFIQKEGTEYIDDLIRAQALSQRFEYMISYILCPTKSKEIFIGVITGWNVKNFLGTSQPKSALRE